MEILRNISRRKLRSVLTISGIVPDGQSFGFPDLIIAGDPAENDWIAAWCL